VSKQRRGRGPEHAPEGEVRAPDHGAHADRDADVEASQSVGNAAFQAGMGHDAGWGESDLLASLAAEQAVAGPGGHVASALRLPARDAEAHARLVSILEASALERRDALIQRLDALQAGALAVDAAVREHLGELTEAERSSWAEAFAQAGGQTEVAVATEVHEAKGADSPGLASLTALCTAILARAPFLEEEEEPLGMDYATEESGM